MKNNSDLFYLCSLIEFIGRTQKQKRGDVVTKLGTETLNRIYKYADTLHCEPIAQTADNFISMCQIPEGRFDNVANCHYEVPDYWTIGEVYERLIEDISENDTIIDTTRQVFTSWIDGAISNYNSDFFYQSREYIKECYLAGEVL
ncbi:MAG: hypothetical protein LUC99_00725 [Clostridiales bacterium]|nr:hypothetical protein [Clostridiales bacterium]